MASEMVLADQTIPASWDVTSDSLAAWLANQLKAEMLLLVKSVELTGSSITPSKLSEMGIVDVAFGKFVKHHCYDIGIVHSSRYDLLRHALGTNAFVGAKVIS
jgi:aspartokinase-like uncharacterized kinase